MTFRNRLAGAFAWSLFTVAGAAAQQCGMSPIATMGGVISSGAALADGRVAIVRGVTLELLDLRDPANPVVLDRRPFMAPGVWGVPTQMVGSGNAVCVLINGDAYLFDVSGDRFEYVGSRKLLRADGTTIDPRGAVMDEGRLVLTGDQVYEVFDVSNPSVPVSLVRQGAWWTYGSLPDGNADRVAVYSSPTIDIADLRQFRHLQMFSLNSGCNTLTVEGSRMFLVDSSSVTGIYDISGAAIRRVGSLGPLGCPPAVTEHAGVTYAVENSEIEALDLSDPANPRVVARVALPGTYQAGVAASGGALMLTGAARVPILDASDPSNLRIAAYYPDAGESYIDAKAHGDVILAVTSDYRKLVSIEYASGELHRVGELSFPSNQQIYAIAADGNLLVASTSSGLQAIDITDPRSPVLKGLAPMGIAARSLVDLDGSLACVATWNGINLVDVSNPDHPAAQGLIQAGIYDDIAIGSGIVASLSSGGMRAWDISNIAAPRNLPFISIPGSPYGTVDIDGDLIAICTSSGLTLYDRGSLSSPFPQPLGGALGPAYDIVLRGNRAWTVDPAFINLDDPTEPFVAASTSRLGLLPGSTPRTAPLVDTVARVDRNTGIAVFSTDVDGVPTIRRGLPWNGVRGCLGEPFELSIEAYSRTPMTYQWFRRGAPIPGATEPTLRFDRLRPIDLTGYYVEITNACGTLREPRREYAPGRSVTACRGDFNCDNFIDWTDYADFLAAFEAGDPKADRNGDDFLDFFDYEEFVIRFDQGC